MADAPAPRPNSRGSADGSEQNGSLLVVHLSGRQRIFFAGIGVLSTGVGVAGIFLSANDLATLGAWLTGAALLALAVLGFFPSRIRYGGLDVGLVARVEAAIEVGETARELAGREAAESVVESAVRTLPDDYQQQVRDRFREATAYEDAALRAVLRTLPPGAELLTGDSMRAVEAFDKVAPSRRVPADGVISAANSRVYIDVKRMSESSLANWKNRLYDTVVKQSLYGGQWLLITNLSAPEQPPRGITWVKWEGEEDDPLLKQAIEAAISGADADDDSHLPDSR